MGPELKMDPKSLQVALALLVLEVMVGQGDGCSCAAGVDSHSRSLFADLVVFVVQVHSMYQLLLAVPVKGGYEELPVVQEQVWGRVPAVVWPRTPFQGQCRLQAQEPQQLLGRYFQHAEGTAGLGFLVVVTMVERQGLCVAWERPVVGFCASF